MPGPSERLARARERLTFARIWAKTRRRAVGLVPGRGEITLIRLKKIGAATDPRGHPCWACRRRVARAMGMDHSGLASAAGPGPASAPPQGASRGENFSAEAGRRSLFASDCTGAGCHKGPQGLARDRGAGSLASFLREHYTNSRESAAALAAYLVGVPGAARADPKQQQPRAARRADGRRNRRSAGRRRAIPAPQARRRRNRRAGSQACARRAGAARPPSHCAGATSRRRPRRHRRRHRAAAGGSTEPPKPQWDIFD